MESAQKPPKFVRFAVMLGIVVALNLFFFVGRSIVLPEPAYENYCPSAREYAATQDACEQQDGMWIENGPIAPGMTKETSPQGYCDYYQKCQPLYDAAHKQFQLYAFVIMVGLGILSIIVGVLPLRSSIVSSGLSYGGVLAFIIAAMQYWQEAATWVQLLISVIALGALLYIGIKRFKD